MNHSVPLTWCNLWDVYHLELPTTLAIIWRMQPIQLRPATVSKETSKDTGVDGTQWKKKHEKAAAFPLLFPPILWIIYYEMLPRKNIIDKNSRKSQSITERQWTSTFGSSDSEWLQRLLKALLLINHNMHPSLPGNHLK